MDVAVIGAGIGGLTAALAHAQAGASVSVFEQANEVPAFGAGLQLGPNAVHVLNALGLEAQIAARASAPRDVFFIDAVSGRGVFNVPLGATIADRHGAAFFQMHRADLIDILLKACAAQGVSVQTARRVEEVSKDGTFRAGGTHEQAEVVVAADGVRSACAKQLFGAGDPQFSGRVAWRATVAMDCADMPTRVWMAPGAHLVTYPLRGGTELNIVAVRDEGGPRPEDWFGAADPDDLRRAFSGFPNEARDLLDTVHEVRTWGLYAHAHRKALVDGRVTLLGDAAHPMLPFFAQGAAMAIEDAWVHCALRSKGAGFKAAYEAARLKRVCKVQSTSTRNGRIYHAKGPLRLARNTAFAALSRRAPEARLAQFDWLYGANFTL